MYLIGKSPRFTEELVNRIHTLGQTLLQDFELPDQPLVLEAVEDLYENFESDQFFLIRDGMVYYQHLGQNLVGYAEGDMVGVIATFDLPTPTLSVQEYAELIPIKRDDFLRHIYSDKRRIHAWTHYLVCKNALYLNLVASQTQGQRAPHSSVQHIPAGEVIIQQGDSAEHVYTLVNGAADVFVDGVRVGDVEEGEVFGAMAVFTGEPRSATVIATTDCTLMSVPQADFVLLIEAQPNAAISLIETLARRITLMNQQLLGNNR